MQITHICQIWFSQGMIMILLSIDKNLSYYLKWGNLFIELRQVGSSRTRRVTQRQLVIELKLTTKF